MTNVASSILHTPCFPEDPLEKIKEEIQAARGEKPGDLLIKNINIVDVYCEQITPGSLLIKNGKIVSISPGDQCTAKEVFDGQGLLASAGLIDPHLHIDGTLVTPDVLAHALVPAGVTTVCAEVLDFAHHEWRLDGEQAAIEAIQHLLKDHDRLPYRLLPLAPGKMVPASVTEELLQWDGFFALGEILPGFILSMDDTYLSLLVLARKLNKWVTGHIIGFVWVQKDGKYIPKVITQDEINGFALAGFSSDHEAWDYQSAYQLLQHGVKPLARGMSGQYKGIVRGMLENKISFENVMFCYDDITFDTLTHSGYINRMVSEAVKMGLDPIKAIKVSTLNVAKEIGLEQKLGSLTTGKFADLILFEDFTELKPEYVFKGGRLVAQHGRLIQDIQIGYAPLRRTLPRVYEHLRVEDLRYPAAGEALASDGLTAQAKLVDLSAFRLDEVWMPVENGEIKPLPAEDKLKLILAERDGARQMIRSFVQGFHLKEGALAVSFTQNAHRIIAVGATDRDLQAAIQAVDGQTGAVVLVRNGAPVEVLPLEISGMMSDLPYPEIKIKFDRIRQNLREMGCDLTEPLNLLWTCGFLFRFQ